MYVGSCYFKVVEKVQLISNIVGYGSVLLCFDVDVEYIGEFVNVNLNVIYLLVEGEFFDLYFIIEYVVFNCMIEENVCGIVGDCVKVVFNGWIYIYCDVQKILVEFNNCNLLLLCCVVVNIKLEFEIYVDDVCCVYGVIVVEIEEKVLYYLLMCGISCSQVLIMLNFGFIQELII